MTAPSSSFASIARRFSAAVNQYLTANPSSGGTIVASMTTRDANFLAAVNKAIEKGAGEDTTCLHADFTAGILARTPLGRELARTLVPEDAKDPAQMKQFFARMPNLAKITFSV